MIEGTASISTEPAVLQRVIDLMNAKYRTDFGVDFLDPEKNATIGVRPRRVFSLRAGDFTGSPTRWISRNSGNKSASFALLTKGGQEGSVDGASTRPFRHDSTV